MLGACLAVYVGAGLLLGGDGLGAAVPEARGVGEEPVELDGALEVVGLVRRVGEAEVGIGDDVVEARLLLRVVAPAGPDLVDDAQNVLAGASDAAVVVVVQADDGRWMVEQVDLQAVMAAR